MRLTFFVVLKLTEIGGFEEGTAGEARSGMGYITTVY